MRLAEGMSLRLIEWLYDRPAESTVAWRGSERLTIAQLRLEVAALSAWMASQTARRWALCLDDAYSFTVALLACAQTGVQAVLPGHRRPAALAELAPHLDAMLVDGDWPGSAELPFPVWSWSSVMPEALGRSSTLPLARSELPLSLLMFTSGSTGLPQPVLKQERELLAEVAVQAQLWAPLMQQTLLLATVSQQHIYGLLFRILLPLHLGVPFWAATLTTPEQLCQVAQMWRQPWGMVSSPAFLEHLDPALPVANGRWLVTSGGPLSTAGATLSRECLDLAAVELYGSSETGGIAWRQERDHDWSLLPGVALSVDAQGDWWLDSPFLPAGERWRLADRIAWQDNGFRLLGRADRIIKLAEKRISLDEVERRLQALDWVQEAVVVPLLLGRRTGLGAVVVPTPQGWQWHADLGNGRLLWRLRQELGVWLEPVALPRRLRCLNALPCNAQGKRQYAELKELFDEA